MFQVIAFVLYLQYKINTYRTLALSRSYEKKGHKRMLTKVLRYVVVY
jgi:hypothetical protein